MPYVGRSISRGDISSGKFRVIALEWSVPNHNWAEEFDSLEEAKACADKWCGDRWDGEAKVYNKEGEVYSMTSIDLPRIKR